MTYLATLKKNWHVQQRRLRKANTYSLILLLQTALMTRRKTPAKNMVSSIRFTRLLVQPIFRNCIYFAASAFFNFTRLSWYDVKVEMSPPQQKNGKLIWIYETFGATNFPYSNLFCCFRVLWLHQIIMVWREGRNAPPPKNGKFTRLLVQPIFHILIYFAASAFFNFTRSSWVIKIKAIATRKIQVIIIYGKLDQPKIP